MVGWGVVGQNGWGSLSGDQSTRGSRCRLSGEQDSRRIRKLEIRMDSVSKPALSKKKLALSPFGCAQGKLRRRAEWVWSDKSDLKRDCIICEILLDGKVDNLV